MKKVGFIIALALFGFCAVLLFVPRDQAKWESHATATLSKVKQIGVAMAAYTEDHNDRYPPAGGSLAKALAPYGALKDSHFTYQTQQTKSAQIFFNELLARRKTTRLEMQNQTICLFGNTQVQGRRLPIGFVDTSAKLVHANKMDALYWRARPRETEQDEGRDPENGEEQGRRN